MDPVRLYHTVKYLKPVQVYGRIWHKYSRPQPNLSPAPGVSQLQKNWAPPIEKPNSMIGPTEFRFLNLTGQIDDGDWNNPTFEKLWLYNLHYFDDLNSSNANDRLAWHGNLVENWINENPPGSGNGWEPYPISLRLVNWIKWHWQHQKLTPETLHSLAVQCRWLEKRLEHHLLGNHLLANAKALVFCGLFFEGQEAQRWLSTGTKIYEEQLAEQVLPDGGHFELSPMYHSIILEDLLDVWNAANSKGNADLSEFIDPFIGPMLNWLATMSHGDGEVSYFNDTAIEGAPNLDAILNYVDRLGIVHEIDTLLVSGKSVETRHLASSGYLRVQNDDVCMIADLASVGPDYLPGHAHADTLSFELSIGAERIIVNRGTSVYGNSRERESQRSTAAHSTVVIDNQNSSEVWGGFRVARRAFIKDLNVQETVDGVAISASHDGYDRLPGRPRHRRNWRVFKDRIEVVDTVSGRNNSAKAHFHIGPEVEVTQRDQNTVELKTNGSQILEITTTTQAEIIESNWHPGFGKSVSTKCIVAQLVDGELTTNIDWRKSQNK